MAPPKLHAAIHLGAHSVRMCVAERNGRYNFRKVENLQVPLLLGQETFTRGRIGHELIRETCDILKGFRQVLESYRVTDVKAVATSAVREASNRDTFVDRVAQTSGIHLEVIEPIEETRLVHRMVREIIHDRFGLDRGATMILSLGGGGSQIILFRDGEVVLSESRKTGTVRLRQLLSPDGVLLSEELDFFVTNVAQTFRLMHDLGAIDTMIVINNTINEQLPRLTKVREYKSVFTVPVEEIDRLAEKLDESNYLELRDELDLSHDDLETLMVAIPQIQAFVGITSARRVVVPNATFIDALLIDEIVGEKEVDVQAFNMQVESAAIHLGRKYHFHEAHATHVRDMAQRLFDGLRTLHGLPDRDRMHLGVAALLHDIGWFVSAQGHHKHAWYIINASEILGLDEAERNMVALVARYHRKTTPRPAHVEFMALPPEQRSRVIKMAALLRIADALDRDLNQNVRDLRAVAHEDEVVVTIELPLAARGSFHLVERAVKQKAELFEESFGTPIRLLPREV